MKSCACELAASGNTVDYNRGTADNSANNMVKQVLICSIFSHSFQFEVLGIKAKSIGSLALTLASSGANFLEKKNSYRVHSLDFQVGRI